MKIRAERFGATLTVGVIKRKCLKTERVGVGRANKHHISCCYFLHYDKSSHYIFSTILLNRVPDNNSKIMRMIGQRLTSLSPITPRNPLCRVAAASTPHPSLCSRSRAAARAASPAAELEATAKRGVIIAQWQRRQSRKARGTGALRGGGQMSGLIVTFQNLTPRLLLCCSFVLGQQSFEFRGTSLRNCHRAE